MRQSYFSRMLLTLLLSMALVSSSLTAVFAEESTEALDLGEEAALQEGEQESVEEILSQMTLEEKISQMIIPAIRTWDEENVTTLSDYPELAEALRAHQYGGIILYAQNVTDAGQVACLVQDLQANNLENPSVSAHIPYFMAADEEGGVVVRLTGGTRMTGSMAIGATGEEALSNAEKTGRLLGEEMAAAGLNVNFAPDIDVNNNPANPVIGTRSFSDDPDMVAELGSSWADGLSESGVISTFKHFPGHGDTVVDSHIGTPSVEKTYEELQEVELVPFAEAVRNGAEMIMTAHITFPEIDDEVTFGDGETKGFYPATMSKKIISGILRNDLGFDGIVVSDALEMGAIQSAGLVPGEPDSAEYRTNIAREVILAGVDILLVPMDLNSADAVAFSEEYIDGLQEMVEDGTIPEERIDESVTRILQLKEKYGILEEPEAADPEDVMDYAAQVIGSDEHHDTEMEIASQAITLLKNEEETLPLSSEDAKIVFLARQAEEAWTIEYALAQLQEEGILESDVQIVNLAQDTVSGEEDAGTKITIDYYYDPAEEENKLHYTEELEEAILEADAVIGFTRTYGLSGLEESSEQYQGIAAAITDTHDAGGRFVLLSNNLPYDAARYQDADAILLAYMGSGLELDPAQNIEESGKPGLYNANVVAAVHLMFGDGTPEGTLPVQIPEIIENEDGSLAYTDTVLYERGFGM